MQKSEFIQLASAILFFPRFVFFLFFFDLLIFVLDLLKAGRHGYEHIEGRSSSAKEIGRRGSNVNPLPEDRSHLRV